MADRNGKGMMGDDRTPNLKVTKEGDQNKGRTTSKAWHNQTVIMDYAQDMSSFTGDTMDERSCEMQGGPTSLSHSIKGATAYQGGDRDNGGRKSSIKQS